MLRTFHEWTYLPDGDDTFASKLPESQLHKEQWNTGEYQHECVGYQKGSYIDQYIDIDI